MWQRILDFPSVRNATSKFCEETQAPGRFTLMNFVHHLKTKPRHEEEFEGYNKLKTEESSGDGVQLRQVLWQETAELHRSVISWEQRRVLLVMVYNWNRYCGRKRPGFPTHHLAVILQVVLLLGHCSYCCCLSLSFIPSWVETWVEIPAH